MRETIAEWIYGNLYSSTTQNAKTLKADWKCQKEKISENWLFDVNLCLFTLQRGLDIIVT